jgi:uncharacterized membrane protein SirB2
MSDIYHSLRMVHIASAYVSIVLFVLRHLLNLQKVAWQKWRTLRILPHVVDTVLLASAIILTVHIHQYPFVNDWLTVKVILLVLYIILGTFALKRGRTEGIRRVAFLAAVIVFAFIISIARTHSPLGVFTRF